MLKKTYSSAMKRIFCAVLLLLLASGSYAAKLTYDDKTNVKPIVDRSKQATAADFNEIKASVNALYDGATIDDTATHPDKTYSSNKIAAIERLLTKEYGDDGRVRFDVAQKHWFFETQESPGVWVQKFEIGGSATVDVINFLEGPKPTVAVGELGMYSKAFTPPGENETLELRLVDPAQKEYGLVVHDIETGNLIFIESDGSFSRAAKLSDIVQGAEKFTDLTDTPGDHNTAGVWNVVNNPFAQRLEYKEAELSDNKDIQISAPASGEIFKYDEGTARWINDEPRLVSALESYNIVDNIDDWQEEGLSVLFANDNNEVVTDTPTFSKEGDLMIIFNLNTEFGKTVVMNARPGETVNGAASYAVSVESIALFTKNGTDWKFGGESSLVTTLSNKSVTLHPDVSNAGSGAIITAAERTKLGDCCTTGEPVEVTSNLVIDSNNYTTYNNRLIQGKKTGGTLVIDLAQISTFNPNGRVLFSFSNVSPDSGSIDIRAGSGDNIKGAFFYRLLVNESVSIEFPASGNGWLVIAESISGDPVPIYATAATTIPISGNDFFVKYSTFASPPDISQPLPDLATVGNSTNLYFYNADPDPTHVVTFAPNGSDTVDQETEFSINGGGELVHFRADPANNNWLLAGLHRDESATESDLTVSGGAVTVDKVKELVFGFPIEVASAGDNKANATILPGHYELRHAPSYYASLSNDEEVVGRTSSGVRTGVLWYDNTVKPAGGFIQIDRNGKAIGLQEDDTLDPNVTGGTPYFIYTRISMKGTAPADGYIQFYLRDKITQDILEDDNGRVLAVRKKYKTDDELGSLDIAAIKKFTGIEEFQICVDEDFGQSEPIVIEDRTEGNSCVLVQAIDSSDQTSRGILQTENDLGKNFEWTSHYIGEKFRDIEYFLKEDRPTTTITPGTGETSTDGWFLNNFTQIKVGVASDTLTIEDDGSNLVGFGFGNIITAEETQLLRGKSFNVYIETTTLEGAGRVYAAKWTGAPDAYNKDVITGISPVGEPILGAGWTILGTSIFCIENPTGNPATYSGAFTMPVDANNLAVFFAPNEEQQPNKYEITQFYFDKDPAISGFFLYAPEEAGESYLIKDTKYFECGLNVEGWASLRYTINQADTAMPAGKLIKGAADITPNWVGDGAAVDFLTFNEPGDADISTSFYVYPGESIPVSGSTSVNFWWAKEGAPGVWTKIPESEVTETVNKTDQPTFISTPTFTFKAKAGDKLRAYASSGINDGAYIQSTSAHLYLCKTIINFTEFVPGSEDEPLSALYVKDELDNDWELTAGTDGHLETLLVGDLPENTDHHVLRTNFSGNDFVIDEFGVITLFPKPTTTEYTEISANVDLDGPRNYIADTLSNTVTINIPYEETSAFTVRDEMKEFDANNCIVTIRDDLNAIAHTATLDKRDKGYIFYNSGGTEDDWRYGEIGKGLIIDVASDHVASTDFGDVYTDTENFDCRNFNVGACYEDPAYMMAVPGAFASKAYVDYVPRLDAYLSTDMSVVLETETVIPFDTVEHAVGVSVSAGEMTFTKGGRYSGHGVLSVNEDRDPETYLWVERKPSGGAWGLFNNMLSVKIKEDGTFVLPGDIEVADGDTVRVKVYFTKSDASLDLEAVSLVVGLGTLTQPSASISFVKVGEVTP